MPATMQRRRARASTALLLVLILGGLVALPSTAVETPESVGADGSWFEILDGNTIVDKSGAGYLDWDNVKAFVKEDLPSGQNDDSFGNGTKEDTAVPSIVTGSIPPNKSDLKEFGYYLEDVPGEPGFLHLFWTRVQDPSGTTNMDFEFNDKACITGGDQSGCSANGVTPIRTIGDLLITYDLSRGGTQATISLRKWTGTVWGPALDLDPAVAVGSINTETITTAINGIEGTYSPRTFGEATINLDAVFDPTVCESFGGAYLKSRASDSFNSALKDFIAPIGVDLANCGRVVVEKVDDVGDPLTGAEFTIAPSNAATPPSSDLIEVGTDTGVFCIDDLLLGNKYTITESVVPDGYEGAEPQPFTPEEIGGCGGINGTTTPDLTFTNIPLLGSIVVEKTYSDTPSAPAQFALITGDEATGEPILGRTIPQVVDTDLYCIDGLSFGDYTVTESTVPDGFVGDTGDPWTVTVDSKSTCDERIVEGELAEGETADVSAHNQADSSILIAKSYDVPLPDGATPAAFALVDGYDEETGQPIPGNTIPQVADTDLYCLDFPNDLYGTEYMVTETFTPNGFLPVADFNVTSAQGLCEDRLAEANPQPDESITNSPDDVDLTVTKYKLSWDELANQGDGGYVETTVGLEGFRFELYPGSDDQDPSTASSTTGPNGATTFAAGILEVGETYTVCETGVPAGEEGYWTDPDDDPNARCQTFTVDLGDDVDLEFYNAPRADVSIGFENVTGYTSAIISCSIEGAEVTIGAGEDGGSLDLSELDLGDYDCTIKIRNGADGSEGGENG
jgi:hypothetical protein